ncbi:MAG TPA: SxtJ family membrane protein [Candidatus Paceibacterota bacterium]|nr:SxtJ family membrane protein [Verrucomicrobiota bacterium]HSA10052.1 SxtJ family membrane protein [Candidatus Paceibacterota bacterium]
MKLSDLPLHPTSRVLRQFAATWLLFFLAIGAYQWLIKRHPEAGLGLAVLAVVIGVLGLLKPAAVRWLFVGWMILAFPIGWVISQMTLIILFYLIITPVAAFFRLRGRDLLMRKPASDRSSFWISKTTPSDVQSYFHQY